MRQAWFSLLIIVLIPVFLLALIVVHELGHTAMARLLGDPSAVFYLVNNDEHSPCIGCTYYDVTRLSWGANLAVSLSGVLTGQLVALASIFLLGYRRYSYRFPPLLLKFMALSFALFDVPWQVFQIFSYNFERSPWPTGADLVDFLLLLQMRLEVSLYLLKGLLLALAMLYLAGFFWFYRRSRMAWSPTGQALDSV